MSSARCRRQCRLPPVLICALAAVAACAQGVPVNDCAALGPVTNDPRVAPAVPKHQHEYPGYLFEPWFFGELDAPASNTRIPVRLRIGADGSVLAVCVVGPVRPNLTRWFAREYQERRFLPATKDGIPTPVTIEVVAEVSRAPSLDDVLRRRLAPEEASRFRWTPLLIATYASTDVATLERLAARGPTRAELARQHWAPSSQEVFRTAALARLGQLGTLESLAAADRVVTAGEACGPATDQFTVTSWPGPAWYYGDTAFMPLAEARAPDGTAYVVAPGNLYGRSELFLLMSKTPQDRASWTRPRLTAAVVAPQARNSSMSYADGTLTLTFEQDAPSGRGAGSSPRPVAPEARRTVRLTRTIVVADVLRDSDGDGLTDIEERRIGTEPGQPDTDRDGALDGADTCPLLASSTDGVAGDTRGIVQAAFFATFGVGDSRVLVKIRPGMARVHLAGYMGPVLYGEVPPPRGWRAGQIGIDTPVWLGWEIVERTPDSATVIFKGWNPWSDWGQNVYLRKMRGRWYVVAQETHLMTRS